MKTVRKMAVAAAVTGIVSWGLMTGAMQEKTWAQEIETEAENDSGQLSAAGGDLSQAVQDLAGLPGLAEISEQSENQRMNLLLIGQDRREDQDRQRSDCMIVLSIPQDGGEIALISVMRDLYVEIPGYDKNRINAAYQYGGMELLDETLYNNFGISIDANVEVDFEEFQEIIDMLGGVEIELNEEEASYMRGSGYDMQAGVNWMDGEAALLYARNRWVGNSDYRRTERQRNIVTALLDKYRDMDSARQLVLLARIFPLCTTDLTLDEMITLAKTASGLELENVVSYRIPVDGAYTPTTLYEGMEVLIPDLEANRAYIQEWLGSTDGEN